MGGFGVFAWLALGIAGCWAIRRLMVGPDDARVVTRFDAAADAVQVGTRVQTLAPRVRAG